MAIRTSKRSTGLWKRRGLRRARPSRGISNLTGAIFRQVCRSRVFFVSAARRRPVWLAVAAVTAAAVVAATACDQGFTVASSPDAGGSRPTPAVAFKTPRTEAAPEIEPTPTAEIEESPPAGTEESPPPETATPTGAPATETPATETATPEPAAESPSPAPTVERTLVPATPDPTAAVDSTAAVEPAPGDTISPEMQDWLVGIFQDLAAGRTAVRPFEFDPALVVNTESNSLAQIMPPQFLQAAFDSKVRSSYFVQAVQIINPADPAQARRPALLSELILVHESEADASSFSSDYRDFAIPLLGLFADQYIQSNFPDAERNFQEDTGFGVAQEEFTLIGEYELGTEEAPFRPQIYIMTGRQRNVNFGLMVLYLDPQARMRPFALFDRIVSRIG